MEQNFRIIDNKTGEELAQYGLSESPIVRACLDCKYRLGLDPSFWKCGARGGKYVEFYNSNADCKLWTPKPTSLVRANQNKIKVIKQTTFYLSWIGMFIYIIINLFF